MAGQKGGHQFLPEVAKGDEQPFAPKCGKIGAKTYEFKRTINLPGRRELEDKVKQKINGVDAEIKKRLNKGVRFLMLHKKQYYVANTLVVKVSELEDKSATVFVLRAKRETH